MFRSSDPAATRALRPRDRVAAIIGASGGLGSGLARKLAREGAGLALADLDDPAVSAPGGPGTAANIMTMRVDVTDSEQVASFAELALAKFGRIDLVITTVGVNAPGQVWTAPQSDWQWLFDVNVWGTLHVIRAFVPFLVAQESGHLVTTGSTAALTSVAGSGAYLASKQAVLGISESLQQDLRAAGSSVRVSVLFPGAVKSRMYDAARHRHVRYGGPRAWDGGDRSEQAAGQAQRDYLESLGGDPDALADILLPQVDAGRFYVFARQEATDGAGEHAAGVRGGMLPLPRFTQTAGPGAHGG